MSLIIANAPSDNGVNWTNYYKNEIVIPANAKIALYNSVVNVHGKIIINETNNELAVLYGTPSINRYNEFSPAFNRPSKFFIEQGSYDIETFKQIIYEALTISDRTRMLSFKVETIFNSDDVFVGFQINVSCQGNLTPDVNLRNTSWLKIDDDMDNFTITNGTSTHDITITKNDAVNDWTASCQCKSALTRDRSVCIFKIKELSNKVFGLSRSNYNIPVDINVELDLNAFIEASPAFNMTGAHGGHAVARYDIPAGLRNLLDDWNISQNDIEGNARGLYKDLCIAIFNNNIYVFSLFFDDDAYNSYKWRYIPYNLQADGTFGALETVEVGSEIAIELNNEIIDIYTYHPTGTVEKDLYQIKNGHALGYFNTKHISSACAVMYPWVGLYDSTSSIDVSVDITDWSGTTIVLHAGGNGLLTGNAGNSGSPNTTNDILDGSVAVNGYTNNIKLTGINLLEQGVDFCNDLVSIKENDLINILESLDKEYQPLSNQTNVNNKDYWLWNDCDLTSNQFQNVGHTTSTGVAFDAKKFRPWVLTSKVNRLSSTGIENEYAPSFNPSAPMYYVSGIYNMFHNAWGGTFPDLVAQGEEPDEQGNRNGYLRLNNLPVQNYNGNNHSYSRIVGVISRNSLGISEQKNNPPLYSKLNNVEPIRLTQLSLSIVDEDEKLCEDLSGGSQITLHLI